MTQEELDRSQRIIDEMIRRVVEALNPVRIVLFGSHARGDARPDSDVDLLVVTDAPGSRRKQAAQAYRALAGVGISTDVVVVTTTDIERWRDVPGTILYPALKEGLVAYERAA